MPKYSVHDVLFANTTGNEVEAETPEKAAEEGSFGAGLCHQCSNEIELGDVDYTYVLDEDGNEVYSTKDTRDEDDAKKWRALQKIAASKTGAKFTLKYALAQAERTTAK